jgi:hypothetical protein
MASFEQTDAQLAGVAQQQLSLRAVVDTGELWMDANVAERAAAAATKQSGSSSTG